MQRGRGRKRSVGRVGRRGSRSRNAQRHVPSSLFRKSVHLWGLQGAYLAPSRGSQSAQDPPGIDTNSRAALDHARAAPAVHMHSTGLTRTVSHTAAHRERANSVVPRHEPGRVANSSASMCSAATLPPHQHPADASIAHPARAENMIRLRPYDEHARTSQSARRTAPCAMSRFARAYIVHAEPT